MSKKWSYEDQQLMRRHYRVFKIFGKEFWYFETSPNEILNHLKSVGCSVSCEEDISEKMGFDYFIFNGFNNNKVRVSKKEVIEVLKKSGLIINSKPTTKL